MFRIPRGLQDIARDLRRASQHKTSFPLRTTTTTTADMSKRLRDIDTKSEEEHDNAKAPCVVLVKKPKANSSGKAKKSISIIAPLHSKTGHVNATDKTCCDNDILKIISFNVNSIRAMLKNRHENATTLNDYVKHHMPDVLILQETKMQEKDINEQFEGLCPTLPYKVWNCSTKKNGYSGTALFSRVAPISIHYGIGEVSSKITDDEGRVIVAEWDNWILVNCYTPNSGAKLERLSYRTTNWDVKFRNLITQLKAKGKMVIVSGDLNCAHENIDIHAPDKNHRSAGFTDEERTSFSTLLDECKLTDVFRHLYPMEQKFTYFGYRTVNARATNKGWRLDYFLVPSDMMDCVKSSTIHSEEVGSDHVPIELTFRPTANTK